MRYFLTALVMGLTLTCFGQNLTAAQLLDNAINYHDPNNLWSAFNDEFTVVMTTPNSPKRTSIVNIDLNSGYFSVAATRDSTTTTYTIDKEKCSMYYNGKLLDSIKAKEKNMSCDRATLYKNYYTYLYGLPMKLKDPGTNLDEKVVNKTFMGKDYLTLRVTYDEGVGSDVWYFYFNPNTYAMDVYQFFKTDENGKEKPDTGEYILLSGETQINGIKVPKVRAWYYNKDDKYLGTDTLIE
ncbi:MAG: hypothetical protein HKN40_14525 [Winogradskyella sp.]|uniref:DUF6503 family protein n=1 Tax=Winogradskyella sp. TaxID=1883156 RepID=UPI0017BF636B|nr:hypothetical protein [Winogradskyella sp.]